MSRSISLLFTAVGLLLALATTPAACGDDNGSQNPDAAPDAAWDGAKTDATAADVLEPDAERLPEASLPDAEPDAAVLCGNGTRDPGEVCDDGNQVSGDGCNASCSLRDGQDLPANGYPAGDQLSVAAAGDARNVAAAWVTSINGESVVWFRWFSGDGLPLTNYQGNQFELAASTAGVPASQPGVSLCPDGSLVVVWVAGDQAAADVAGGVFDNLGQQTASFQATPAPTSGVSHPAVACDQSAILVSWHSDQGLFFRLFDEGGNPVTNAATGSDGPAQLRDQTATQPDAAALPGAGWVIVWTDQAVLPGDSGTSIQAARIQTDGAVADTFWVNSTQPGAQNDPAVAAQPSLGFVVVWADASNTDDTSFTGIRMRLFDMSGQPRQNGVTGTDEDFPINTYTTGRQTLPAVTVLSARILVAWQDGSGSDGSFAGIRGRLFSSDGTPVVNPWSGDTEDVRLNTSTLDAQLAPAVAPGQDVFFSFWVDQGGPAPDGDGSSIRYRLVPTAL